MTDGTLKALMMATITVATFALTQAAHAVPAAATPAVAPASVSTLSNVSIEAGERSTIIEITLDRAPAWSEVGTLQDHGTFLQLMLPGTLVPEPGKFYDAGGPAIAKSAVFQLTPSDAGVRFFVTKNSAAVLRSTSTVLLGRRIVLTVDHDQFAAAISLAAAPAAAAPTVALSKTFVGPPNVTAPKADEKGLTAAQVIAQTEVDKSSVAPSDLLKGQGASLGLSKGVDLRAKLVQVAAFSGFMLVLMAAAWLARPIMRRRRRMRSDGGGEPPVEMKTIASLPLAPRQKISLIQVGDEKFLIGISPEQVAFLTAVGSQKLTASVAGLAGLSGMASMTGLATGSRVGALAAAPRQPQGSAFGGMLEDDGATVPMRQAPRLKKLPGNDPESLRADGPTHDGGGEAPRRSPTLPRARPSAYGNPAPAPTAEGPRVEALDSAASDFGASDEDDDDGHTSRQAASRGGRVNIRVGDDGVKDMRGKARPAASTPKSPGQGQGGQGQQRQAADDVTKLIREKLKALRETP